jgi:hypothetical protein
MSVEVDAEARRALQLNAEWAGAEKEQQVSSYRRAEAKSMARGRTNRRGSYRLELELLSYLFRLRNADGLT